jgi:cytochrome c-type biogenesis protein CcmH/NrfG
MDNKNKINIKTGEKHFDIPKSRGAVDLRARNNEEKNIEEKPASENVFKSFLKKHKTDDAPHPNPLPRGERVNSSFQKGDGRDFGGIFDKAIIGLLYFLVFALPLFILPFSMEIYEFNKVLLLFFISSLAFLLWVTKMIIIDRRLTFAKTPLNTPIIIFIFLTLISAAFSVDKISSILGFYGRFSDSLMVYLSLAMLYFVVVNVATCRDEALPRLYDAFTNNLIKAFIASSFIIVIVGLFYFFGFKFIPWQETQFRSFNLTSGSLNVFGIYLTAVILIALHYRRQAANAFSRNLMLSLISIALVLLAIIDFVVVWIVLAVSLFLALVLTFVVRRRGVETRHCLVSTILIILISLVFIGTSLTVINKDIQANFSSSLISTSIKNRIVSPDNNLVASNDGFNREVILDKNTAIAVAVEGIKQDPIAGIIGSGPGTYLYNFSKFKPAEFNNNLFWNIRFDKAGSEILEKASTIGILGALSYLLIIVLVAGMFLRGRHSGMSPSNIYLFVAWFALLLFQFLYLEATTTKFIFWLLTAILAAEYYISRRRHSRMSPSDDNNVSFILDLKKEKSSFYLSLLVLIILSLSFASAYYYQIRFYQAEAGYKKVVLRQNEALAKSGLSADQIWEVLNKNTDELKEIIAKNPHCGTYKIYLSDIYLNRMSIVFQEESQKDEDERNNQRIAEEAKNTIDYAKSAADENPNNIIFQYKIADVYMTASRDIGITGADEWAVKKYRKAIELEPTNPILHTSFGKIYALYYSVTESDENINQAISEFEKALELKKDYIDAGLQLGIAYENAGNNQKAIDILSSMGSVQRIESVIAVGKTVTSQSVDVDIAFQLGRIYYNTAEIGKAKDIFIKIAKVNPNNSNARYSLGLVYEKEENYEDALFEFRAVLSLNPENEDVKNKIEKLEKNVNKKPEPEIELELEIEEDE